jgi:hypothetical protein
MARWKSCNVLHIAPDTNRLWQFDARGGGFALTREHHGPALPARVVAKSWRSLWQPKLNLAWLPPENVFLRVIELPRSDFDETLAMVELQLERLSPMPVTQIVWTIHVLSASASRQRDEPAPEGPPPPGESAAGNLQTVVVAIVARSAVEEFLGQLEGRGYLADRLEVPFLDQLEMDGSSRQPATPRRREGGDEADADAWVYPLLWGGRSAALVAWWGRGVLRNLGFVTLPPAGVPRQSEAAAGDRAAELKSQLAVMAWSGELEGWLTAPPRWHLVADPVNAAEWENLLRAALNEPVRVSPPLPPAELAGRTAGRAAAASDGANLLPAEFSARYHEQLVDRLWLRGLGAVGVLYAVGVAIYFCAVGVLNYRTQGVERQVAALSGTYTNAIQLKARYAVLKERQELKYAALDCWKVVAERLPEGLTLQRLSFADGRKLTLNGTATSSQLSLLSDQFYDGVRKAELNGQRMFDLAGGEPLTWNQIANNVNWRFTLQLQRTEASR